MDQYLISIQTFACALSQHQTRTNRKEASASEDCPAVGTSPPLHTFYQYEADLLYS
jgi:hypothetical protein